MQKHEAVVAPKGAGAQGPEHAAEPAREASHATAHRVLQLQRSHGNRHVQRMIALARKEEKEGGGGLDPEVESSIQRMRGGGQPLDTAARERMEPAFGADFSGVRIHTGSEADRLNRAISARAFATGRDVFFRQGEYNPGSPSGRELLAHELTHVVQQNGSTVQGKLTLGQPGDRYEQEADEMARRVMRSETASATATAEPGVQRCAACEKEMEGQGPVRRMCAECEEKLARAGGVVQRACTECDEEKVDERLKSREDQLADAASTEFLKDGWAEVNDLGIVYKEGTAKQDGGVTLRLAPGGKMIRWLPGNTKVFILKESAKHHAYAVSVIAQGGAAGEFGYVNKDYVWRNLPDPDADVAKVKSGESPIELAGKHYTNKGFDIWGKDKRYVVNALVWVNQQAAHNGKGESGIRKEALDDAWYETKSTADVYIWLPGPDYLNAIYETVRKEGGGTGSITADLWNKVKDVARKIAYGLAFVGGLLHGFVKSLWDAVTGLIGTAVDVLVSIFTGSVLSDAKELWEALSKITWADIKEAVTAWAEKWDKKLNSSSPWVAGHAHGYLTGYVMAEAAQLLLTGGTIEALKGALWASRLGKAIKATRAFQKLAKGIEKAGEVGGKVKKAIGAAAQAVVKSRPFTVLADARRWVGAVLRLSAETLGDLSLSAINRLRTLSDDAMEALSRLAQPLKRVILGCESPCKVDLDAIQAYLATLTSKAAKSAKKLETLDDILKALPSGLNPEKIRKKLKAHPAFVEAIKKSQLTADDLKVIEKFLTPADLANADSAYNTFTRTMSALIPAKVGGDVKVLNEIAEVIIAMEPRWGAAFKGPMFESFAKLHLDKFRNLRFGRATFEKAKYKFLAKSRTSDGFIDATGALWDFKHTAAKVDAAQAEDYFKIFSRGLETAEGKKAGSINYLFATKEGAEKNADLVKKGFNVFYATPPDVVTPYIP